MKTVLHINNEAVTLEAVECKGKDVRFNLNSKSYHFHGRITPNGFVLEEETLGGFTSVSGVISNDGKGAKRVQLGALEAKISEVKAGVAAVPAAAALSPTAPMPGLIRQVLVKKGDKVKQGQALVVMEAMKLQTTLCAGGNGTVEAVLVKQGDLVTEGAELVRVKA